MAFLGPLMSFLSPILGNLAGKLMGNGIHQCPDCGSHHLIHHHAELSGEGMRLQRHSACMKCGKSHSHTHTAAETQKIFEHLLSGDGVKHIDAMAAMHHGQDGAGLADIAFAALKPIVGKIGEAIGSKIGEKIHPKKVEGKGVETEIIDSAKHVADLVKDKVAGDGLGLGVEAAAPSTGEGLGLGVAEPKKEKKLSDWNMYVKTHMKSGTSLKELSVLYKAEKEAKK